MPEETAEGLDLLARTPLVAGFQRGRPEGGWAVGERLPGGKGAAGRRELCLRGSEPGWRIVGGWGATDF